MLNKIKEAFENRLVFYAVFIIFQGISCYCWWADFNDYIGLVLIACVALIVAKRKFDRILLQGILALVVLYTSISLYVNSPVNTFLDTKEVKEQTFKIERSDGKAMHHQLFRGIVVYLPETSGYVIMQCSLLLKNCDYRDQYGENIVIQYVDTGKHFLFGHQYYVFGLSYKGQAIGAGSFINRYQQEQQLTLYFIISYLMPILIFSIYCGGRKFDETKS